MQRDRSMAVDVISEFLHTGGPPLNADDAAIAIVDVLEREGFNLDRVRDARGDGEAARPKLTVEIGCSVDRFSSRMCERGTKGCVTVHSAARSPQGEDHEAAHRDLHNCMVRVVRVLRDGDMTSDERHGLADGIFDVLVRSSPSRDGSVAVEDVRRLGDAMARAILDLRMHEGRAAWDAAEIARDKWLAEFSPASTGDREENDERRP